MGILFDKRLAIRSTVLVLLILQQNAEGRPDGDRRKRLIGGLGLNFEDENSDLQEFNEIGDNDLDEREARRAPGFGGSGTTFPPFPDDDEYDRYVTQEPAREPQTAPPLYTPAPSEEVINTNTNEGENGGEETPFHEKVLPWFKRQWGHTKNFFKKHYQSAKNQIGV